MLHCKSEQFVLLLSLFPLMKEKLFILKAKNVFINNHFITGTDCQPKLFSFITKERNHIPPQDFSCTFKILDRKNNLETFESRKLLKSFSIIFLRL